VGVAYYNEKDPFAAEWLRKLIAANMIAPGDVDERSIEDVVPLELAKYVQCHFFAGIGVWSYAMRRAGWPDDRRSWSGSCPCQPFSQAGQGAGFADERHLWPAFFHLIEQCRPDVVFGEQVASPDGLAWLDLVQSDMEGTNYAFGALDQCAAGFGAPHIRQRLYWMAYATSFYGAGDAETVRLRSPERSMHSEAWEGDGSTSGVTSSVSGLANNNNAGLERRNERRDGLDECSAWPFGMVGGMANNNGTGPQSRHETTAAVGYGHSAITASPNDRRSSTNGYWRAADWLRCKDDKWRPVEPSAFPLANGITNPVGLLRGYGNAIVAPQAEEFIKAAMQYMP
jgi:DNA (cytosine-5)-methyltransferase 1